MVSPTAKRIGAHSGNFAAQQRKANAVSTGQNLEKKSAISTMASSSEVRQAFSSFRGGESPNRPPLPAANTIKQFIAHVESASLRDVDIDAADFRKCLFSLGLTSDDAALVLDTLDPKASGFMDARVLAKHFLPNNVGATDTSSANKRSKFALEGIASKNAGADAQVVADERAMKQLHRKVIERVLVKSKAPNIKDAFRQYDVDKTGSLTLPQFRTFMRDHGFAGVEVERLIKHLDRDNHGAISFHAFSGDVKLGVNQAYPKASPKKQHAPQPLGGSPSIAKSVAGALDAQDPMDSIRAKLRQRVMGHNKSIREVFLDFDDDGNGHLDHDEFKRFMAMYKFTAEEAAQAIAYLDRDFSGTIDYDEFAAGLLFYRPPPAQVAPSPTATASSLATPYLKHSALTGKLAPVRTDQVVNVVQQKLEERLHVRHDTESTRQRLRDEFRRYDAENKRGLDYQEFGAFLVGMGIKLRPDELSALIALVDADGSGVIEFDEFAQLYPPIAGGDDGRDDRDGDGASVRDAAADRDAKLVAVFNKYDADGSGYLDYEEFAQLMRDYGLTESDILHVIKQVDQDDAATRQPGRTDGRARGRVSYATFASVVQKRRLNLRDSSPSKRQAAGGGGLYAQWVTRVLQKHRSLEDAFCTHDTDGSGELDYDEFRRFMRHYGMKRDSDIDALIDRIDGDGSGAIGLDEFLLVFDRARASQADKQQTQGRKKARLGFLREKELLWVQAALREHGSVQDAFRAFDRHGRSELGYPQFRSLMARFGIDDDDDVALLLKRLDVDNSGTVDLGEFLTVFSEQRLAQQQKANTRGTNGPTQRPTPSVAVQQRRERAARARRSEDAWVQRAVDAHGSVRAAFEAFDADDSGELDYDEFRRLLSAFGISEREHVETLTKRLDADSSGAIDYDEFAAIFYDERAGKVAHAPPRRASATSPRKATAENRKARAARQRELEVKWMKRVLSCHPSIEAAFNEYDADDSKELDHDEFRRFMTRYGIVRVDDIAALLKRLDVDGSGTVDYDEFCAVFNPLRISNGDRGEQRLAGLLSGAGSSGDDEPFSAEELESILEIERELAARMLEKVRDLRTAFRKYDLNGNGRLEYKEFRQVLRAYRFPEPEIRRVIRHLDRNVSGYIDYKGFIAGFSAAKESNRGAQAGGARKNTRHGVARAHETDSGSGAASESRRGSSLAAANGELSSGLVERLKKDLLSKILSTYGTVQSVFRQYDSQQQGRLTESQFEALATDHGLSKSDARLLLEAFDQDRSGTIEYAEFLAQLVVQVSV
ncbi:hypothetical protein PybrP1_009506 [[Pythium] brassicae (nom. inval.)]|nr:hypothetical protein PybrP1_009506 [[Pythium] brassicae (nom. inval.)]